VVVWADAGAPDSPAAMASAVNPLSNTFRFMSPLLFPKCQPPDGPDWFAGAVEVGPPRIDGK
jgi:hypothetical protein